MTDHHPTHPAAPEFGAVDRWFRRSRRTCGGTRSPASSASGRPSSGSSSSGSSCSWSSSPTRSHHSIRASRCWGSRTVSSSRRRRASTCWAVQRIEPEHIFGLDSNFRDVFSRVVIGSRISIGIGFAAVGFAIIIGGMIGAVAGYVGGKTDNVLMRFMDVLPGVPVAPAGDRHRAPRSARTSSTRMLAIGIVSIPIYARIVRASVLGARENDYRHGLARARRIVGRHPDPADHAERAHAADRAGHARDRDRRTRDRGPGLRRRASA